MMGSNAYSWQIALDLPIIGYLVRQLGTKSHAVVARVPVKLGQPLLFAS